MIFNPLIGVRLALCFACRFFKGAKRLFCGSGKLASQMGGIPLPFAIDD